MPIQMPAPIQAAPVPVPVVRRLTIQDLLPEDRARIEVLLQAVNRPLPVQVGYFIMNHVRDVINRVIDYVRNARLF